jgi:hypothetical protein
MIVKPEDADAKSTFQRVQKLRNMNDFALFAKACCNCNLKVIESLATSAITPLQHSYDLAAQMTTLRGYVESSDVLECRIRNAIDLVCADVKPFFPFLLRKEKKLLIDDNA